MATKIALLGVALLAMALAGCTGGSDNDGSSETSTSGDGGVGGGVTGPGVGGNATVTGSASGSGSMTNTSTGGDSPDRADVTLQGTQFMPEEVTIKMGGTVVWTHRDGTQKHTVTSDDGAFDSHPECASPLTPINDCLDDGETFEYTFPTVGTFSYHCKIHPEMTGVVTVEQ